MRLEDRKTTQTYNRTRQALIRIVRAVHPTQNRVARYFPHIGPFIQNFSTIVSLNYDLILYWAFLWANATTPAIKFKDCFPNGLFDYDWRKYRACIRGERKAILVFYPHGNLALGTDDQSNEQKITAGDIGAHLLSRIIERWDSRTLLPLFVNEGATSQKLAAIRRSRYLGRIHDSVLEDLGRSLVIYGSSLQPNDEHILKAILRGRVTRIAISVHTTGNPTWSDICLIQRERINRIAANQGRNVTVTFFDSASPGAWIH